jgi:hypothetical protein
VQLSFLLWIPHLINHGQLRREELAWNHQQTYRWLSLFQKGHQSFGSTTASTTQFHVHKSVLKIHSTIPMDMLTLAQPDDQPNIDGCPVVVVTDVADDGEELLTMLYHTER